MHERLGSRITRCKPNMNEKYEMDWFEAGVYKFLWNNDMVTHVELMEAVMRLS